MHGVSFLNSLPNSKFCRIGTTGKGIGPAYSAKSSRSALKVQHLFSPAVFTTRFKKLAEERHRRYGSFELDVDAELERYLGAGGLAEKLKPYVVDGLTYLHQALGTTPPGLVSPTPKNILIEGANALMLDIDWGTYPFVTSSATGIGGICTGLGISPKALYAGSSSPLCTTSMTDRAAMQGRGGGAKSLVS